MTRPHFTEDFKIDAVKQITERGYPVADVSKRFGVVCSIYRKFCNYAWSH